MQLDVLANFVDKAIDTAPPDGMPAACGNDYAPYYHLVYLLAKYMAPCNIVELGVAHGRFLHCAAMASNDNAIIGVDIVHYPGLNSVLSRHNNVVFVNEASVPVPDELISPAPISIDVLHIDTLHTYNQVKGEFEAYKYLLSDGAVVMFDDLRADDIVKFFDELPYPKIRDDRLHTALGYGVVVI